MNWFKKVSKIRGGLADNKSPSDFDQKGLMRGVEIEMEHTKDKELSKDIAMDHLVEFSDYYTELDKMEKKLEDKEASDHEPIERMLEDALVVNVDKPTPTKRRKRRGKGSGFPHNENPIRQREMSIN